MFRLSDTAFEPDQTLFSFATILPTRILLAIQAQPLTQARLQARGVRLKKMQEITPNTRASAQRIQAVVQIIRAEVEITRARVQASGAGVQTMRARVQATRAHVQITQASVQMTRARVDYTNSWRRSEC